MRKVTRTRVWIALETGCARHRLVVQCLMQQRQAASPFVSSVNVNEKENRDGKGRRQRERHARRSNPGPGWRRGLQPRWLGWSHWRPGSGRGGGGGTRRGARRRGFSVGPAELRVPGRPVAIPKRPVGGEVERPAQGG